MISNVLRIVAVVAALWGVGICATASGTFMGGSRVWLYFTIQSNIWIALCLLAGLIYRALRRQPGRAYDVLQMVLTVSICLTGVVFCFVLAPTMGNGAFNLPNVLTHVVSPIAALADYLICCRSFRLRRSDAFYGIVPPLYYLGFASVGYVLGWEFAPGVNYPYFFLNWGSPAGAFGFSDSLPFMGVMYYVLIMLVSLYLLSLGLIRISHSNK